MDSFRELIEDLRLAGYAFRLISSMREDATAGKVAYLRHDIDLHLNGVERFARMEADLGVRATYFVPLTLHFNPLFPPNRRVLDAIAGAGHEIGLHYDLETYPRDPAAARRHLDWETGLLGALTGQAVRTICLHNPHKGEPDPFQRIDELINPQDPRLQADLLYVSDSCRAWRDTSLLRCLARDGPRRLQLATHPELWLDGSVRSRTEYLHRVVVENGLRPAREYFENTVREIWQRHPAPRLHDERERSRG